MRIPSSNQPEQETKCKVSLVFKKRFLFSTKTLGRISLLETRLSVSLQIETLAKILQAGKPHS